MSAKSFLEMFGRRPKEDRVYLGRIHKSLFGRDYLTESQLNHHVHVVGASGFGKTVFLSQIIRQRISQGKGLFFIDLKSDRDTINQFMGYARAANRASAVQILTLSDKSISTPYNLLGGGTATQLRDRVMLSLMWSEEFYRNQASSFLLKAFMGMCWLREHRGLKLNLGTLHIALTQKKYLAELTNQIPDGERKIRQAMEEVVAFTTNQDSWASLQGLRTQIESIVLSDFGDLVANDESGIDLFETVANGKIVLLFLDTRRYGETAKAIGRFILQDLKFVSARIDAEVAKHNRSSFSVIIDEFADLAQEDFIGFLDRARSSKMSIIVSHQELCDLDRISPEFAGRLMGNTSSLYAFLQKRSESAEVIAGIAGTRSVKRSTERYSRFLFLNIPSGETSVREVEEYVIHPNSIKSLGVGECVCIKKYPRAGAYRATINRPKEGESRGPRA